MNTLRGYFHPSSKKPSKRRENGEKAVLPSSLEMTTTPPQGSINSTPMGSPLVSRPASLYPEGDFRNDTRENIIDIKADVMVTFIHQQQREKVWYSEAPNEGVVLKKGRKDFTCSPDSLRLERNGLFEQVATLNVRVSHLLRQTFCSELRLTRLIQCAMTVNTHCIRVFLTRHVADYVPLSEGLRLQVLPSVSHLYKCQKHHFGAFIQDQRLLIVWDDEPKNLLKRAESIEESLIHMVWKDDEPDLDEKKSPDISTVSLGDGTMTPGELEDALATKQRPTLLINPLMVGFTLTLLVAALGSGWRSLAQEVAVDGKFLRLALLAVTPCQVFVSLFFMQIVIVNLAQIFGPISQLNINSKFYSGIAPLRLDRNKGYLPHVTIQMPVYKEGLLAVIQPTILSLKAAISTYELQGGTANIFVNDDGIQLIPEDEAQARRDFYEEHSVGWVSRPKHNPKPEGGEQPFLRRGKFKKASNMNYALMISNKVEDKLLAFERSSNWTQEDEYAAYDQSLAETLVEEEGRAHAEGNIRVGDYILLIDSDTRVPVDCLLDAASEMEQSPEVGILQYSSGVMQVTTSFFENG